MFYVVATPIGNLRDITLRALDVLRYVDIVAAEDTRVTSKLLSRYNIRKRIISYREQVHSRAARQIKELLRAGKNIALVTDAGTPAISDPGSRLVREILDIGYPITAVPGPSAVITALSVSGVNADRFIFLGYPPSKKGRKTFFENIADTNQRMGELPIVLYESPHRILRTISELCDAGLSRFSIVVIKEISKVYEAIIRMSMADVKKYFENEKKIRGEFVLVINKKNQKY